MRIAQEEIFGPVISAIPFTDVEEVIRRDNATTFGLGGGMWTRDVSMAPAGERAQRRVGADQLLAGDGPGRSVRRLQDERLRARGHLQQMEEYLSVKAV
jgi:aldehyde dehydrogenase (NAD+)